jgi:hypothetical protein
MIAQISLDCPHCLNKKVAFQIRSGFIPAPGNPSGSIALLICPLCGEGVIAKIRTNTPGMNFPQAFGHWVGGQMGMPAGTNIYQSLPKPAISEAPASTPENVKRFYLQGMDNVAQNFDAAGTMFRKCLDTALKHLDPNGKGNLEKRIDHLPEVTGVTPAMKTWAHEIRRLGNDAAHEEDPFTQAEAKSLQAFTEVFLTYAFTLPGMLEARKTAVASITTT